MRIQMPRDILNLNVIWFDLPLDQVSRDSFVVFFYSWCKLAFTSASFCAFFLTKPLITLWCQHQIVLLVKKLQLLCYCLIAAFPGKHVREFTRQGKHEYLKSEGKHKKQLTSSWMILFHVTSLRHLLYHERKMMMMMVVVVKHLRFPFPFSCTRSFVRVFVCDKEGS